MIIKQGIFKICFKTKNIQNMSPTLAMFFKGNIQPLIILNNYPEFTLYFIRCEKENLLYLTVY